MPYSQPLMIVKITIAQIREIIKGGKERLDFYYNTRKLELARLETHHIFLRLQPGHGFSYQPSQSKLEVHFLNIHQAGTVSRKENDAALYEAISKLLANSPFRQLNPEDIFNDAKYEKYKKADALSIQQFEQQAFEKSYYETFCQHFVNRPSSDSVPAEVHIVILHLKWLEMAYVALVRENQSVFWCPQNKRKLAFLENWQFSQTDLERIRKFGVLNFNCESQLDELEVEFYEDASKELAHNLGWQVDPVSGDRQMCFSFFLRLLQAYCVNNKLPWIMIQSILEQEFNKNEVLDYYRIWVALKCFVELVDREVELLKAKANIQTQKNSLTQCLDSYIKSRVFAKMDEVLLQSIVKPFGIDTLKGFFQQTAVKELEQELARVAPELVSDLLNYTPDQ